MAIDALPEHWKAALHESARGISTDLDGAIKALASNTAGGIDDLRTAIEDWFDQSMASVSGWYKRWTMAVQLVIGIVLACALNIDTVHIIRELSVNEPLRRSLAAQAEAYAKTGVIEQRVITADTSRSLVRVSVRSTGVGAFTLGLPAEAAGKAVAVNASDGFGEVLACDAQAALDPEAKDPSAAEALVTCRVAARQLTTRTKVSLDASYTVPPSATATVAALDVFLLPSPEVQYRADREGPPGDRGADRLEARGPLSRAGRGRNGPPAVRNGWLFTALAGSLGAPFWFDLLKRVANLRASGPNPIEQKT